MTVAADSLTADLKVRFDRKPVSPEEWDLINDMKHKYDFKWTGYKEDGKWNSNKLAVVAFEDKVFRARIKKACGAVSFYTTDGQNADMQKFIENVKAFDPDDIDDDLSSLGKSKVPPDTVCDACQRTASRSAASHTFRTSSGTRAAPCSTSPSSRPSVASISATTAAARTSGWAS